MSDESITGRHASAGYLGVPWWPGPVAPSALDLRETVLPAPAHPGAPPSAAGAADQHAHRPADQPRAPSPAVRCEGRSTDQLRRLAGDAAARQAPALFTRVPTDRVGALLAELPGAVHVEEARTVVWPGRPPEPTGGRVLVLAADAPDVPVATEAAVAARHLGRACDLLVEVGAAALDRTPSVLEALRAARAVVVVAGMDGALAGAVAGRCALPVVAVPTSSGHGASFSGLAPLLAMLTATAPGVAVVNIDDGQAAGHLAALIAAPAAG